MSVARSFAAPLTRNHVRPLAARSPLPLRLASLRAHIAAISTVSDVIIHDHRELKDYYNEVVNSTDRDHQDRYGNQFVWELARHSIAEELVVYPAFEKHLGPKGKAMADEDRKQHHRVGTNRPGIPGLADSLRSKNISKNSRTWTPYILATSPSSRACSLT